MKKLLILGTLLLAGCAKAGTVRLSIKHADPQVIYLLLSGNRDWRLPPEVSLVRSYGNGSYGSGGSGNRYGSGGSGNGSGGPGNRNK